jgi:hypothetical protein
MNPEIRPRIQLTAEQKALKDKMLKEVKGSSYKAVSFKMTGTLVITPFSEHSDIFMLMEDDFKDLTTVKKSFTELRVAAEEAAEMKYASQGGATLSRIYDILEKTGGLSPSSRDKLYKRECELIVYFSIPRGFGKELFKTAKKAKKKTIIVADTIYPRNVIVNILSHCGYENCDELIVLSEISLNISDNRAVYEAITKKVNGSASKLLHIGGDVVADVEVPIMNGSKALLLSGVIPLMVKSGRLRGFVQAKQVYDYDTPDFLALHCLFGIYAAYLFDVPQNKQAQSDFCNDEYMLGAIVGGALKVADIVPEGDIAQVLYDIINNSERSREGMEDMANLYHAYFDGHLSKFGFKGCTLPLEFLVKHAAIGDRSMLQSRMSAADFVKWSEINHEAEIAPVYGRKMKQNGMSKLADKLFPPGTKVRNIADGLLVKMKEKSKF